MSLISWKLNRNEPKLYILWAYLQVEYSNVSELNDVRKKSIDWYWNPKYLDDFELKKFNVCAERSVLTVLCWDYPKVLFQ